MWYACPGSLPQTWASAEAFPQLSSLWIAYSKLNGSLLSGLGSLSAPQLTVLTIGSAHLTGDILVAYAFCNVILVAG